MSIFDNKRLTNETFKLDIERMRRSWYSDKYFENIGRMLTALAGEGYNYSGAYHNLPQDVSPEKIACRGHRSGNAMVHAPSGIPSSSAWTSRWKCSGIVGLLGRRSVHRHV